MLFFFSFFIFSCFAKMYDRTERGLFFRTHNHTIMISLLSILLSLPLSSPLSTHKCLLFIHPRRKIGIEKKKNVFSSLIALWLCCGFTQIKSTLIFASLPDESNQKLHKYTKRFTGFLYINYVNVNQSVNQFIIIMNLLC